MSGQHVKAFDASDARILDADFFTQQGSFLFRCVSELILAILT